MTDEINEDKVERARKVADGLAFAAHEYVNSIDEDIAIACVGFEMFAVSTLAAMLASIPSEERSDYKKSMLNIVETTLDNV